MLFASGCQSLEPEAGFGGEEAAAGTPQRFELPALRPVAGEAEAARPLELRVVGAADISARNRPDFTLSDNGRDPSKEQIQVELLNYWDSRDRYFVNLNFKNPGKQVFKTIFVFGYDKLGRLVSTRGDQTFFREKSNLVRTLSFRKSEPAVRWTVRVKS